MKIDIVQLNEKDIGKWVWYKPTVGDWEKGKIKSWNSENIFVVYKCNGEWKRFKDFTAAATKPEDLEYIKHQDHCKALEGYMCACLAPTIKLEEKDLLTPPETKKTEEWRNEEPYVSIEGILWDISGKHYGITEGMDYIKKYVELDRTTQSNSLLQEIEKMKKPDEPKRNIVRRSHIEVYNKAIEDILNLLSEHD